MRNASLFSPAVRKIVLSGAVKDGPYTRADIVRNGGRFQASLYTGRKVVHKNIHAEEAADFVSNLLGAAFTHCHAWDNEYEYSARVTKKGKILSSRKPLTQAHKKEAFAEGFNRKKKHIIDEGTDIPVLLDMGVFTRELKIAAPMRDKFTQINRFLELLEHEMRDVAPGAAVNIIDFGCGKSYLTFVMYHYFTEMRGLRVQMCGLDNDADIIRTCAEAGSTYGYTGLHFLQGDIGQQKKPPLENWGQEGAFQIVVCLHACDTATDYALYNAVQWGTDLICAVPCCQHELRGQMQAGALPLFSRYGIIQERVASLATDAIRAALLEWQGYKVQIIELTDRENTAKNLMIRARKKSGKASDAALKEAQQLMEAFGFMPTLGRLLSPSN